jgi:hypothetical protein
MQLSEPGTNGAIIPQRIGMLEITKFILIKLIIDNSQRSCIAHDNCHVADVIQISKLYKFDYYTLKCHTIAAIVTIEPD